MTVNHRRGNGWLRVGLFVLVLGLLAYRGWNERQQPELRPAPPGSNAAEAVEADRTAKSTPARIEIAPIEAAPVEAAAEGTTVRDQTIRDQAGEIAFRGDVELSATLARIERRERLRFSNDGSVFQNRERRLPRRESGYYHEYVHPTPGLSGPGPQRIVTGAKGEIYYTPDHYRTFQRLDQP